MFLLGLQKLQRVARQSRKQPRQRTGIQEIPGLGRIPVDVPSSLQKTRVRVLFERVCDPGYIRHVPFQQSLVSKVTVNSSLTGY